MVDYVPKLIKNAVKKTFLRAKNSVVGLYDGAKKILKSIVEKEAEEEQQQEEDIDLTSHEHERALKGAYRRFVIPVGLKQMLIVILIKPNHPSRR